MALFISSGNEKKSDTLGSLRHARFMEAVTNGLIYKYVTEATWISNV